MQEDAKHDPVKFVSNRWDEEFRNTFQQEDMEIRAGQKPHLKLRAWFRT